MSANEDAQGTEDRSRALELLLAEVGSNSDALNKITALYLDGVLSDRQDLTHDPNALFEETMRRLRAAVLIRRES